MSDVTSLVFQGKPTDNIETVTAEQMRSSEVINSMTDAMRRNAQSIASSIQESMKSGKEFAAEVLTPPTSVSDPFNRMMGIIGDTAAAGAAATNQSITSVMQIIDATKSGIAEFGGQLIGDTNLLDCPPNELFNALGSYFGDSRMFNNIDLAAMAGMLLNMLECLINGGINAIVGPIVDLVPNEVVRTVVSIETAVLAAKAGDIDTVLAMTDRVGNDAVLGRSPHIASSLMAKVRPPIGLQSSKYRQWADELTDRLASLQPKWDEINDKVNLGVFGSLQPETKSVLTQDPKWLSRVLVAEMPFESDINKVGQQAYPNSIYSKQGVV